MLKQFLKLLTVLPVSRKRICLLCFDGSKIGWDAKAMVDYINEQHLDYEIIWLVKSSAEVQKFHLENVTFKVYKSLAGIIALMTSKYVIYNIRVPSEVTFRKEQVLINTWHGFAFKKVGKYTEGFSIENLNRADAMISHAEYYTEHVLKDSFDFRGDILACGAPRNDVFFDPEKRFRAAAKAREQLSIDSTHRVVLFAPTFREGYIMPESQLDTALLKQSLQERFGGPWDVVYRLHPVAKQAPGLDLSGCIDGSGYDDMQELLCLADVLVTDYSSSMWDFSLQKKPVFLFADDMESYSRDRGLYSYFNDVPYIICSNNSALKEAILSYNQNDYERSLDRFAKKIGNFEHGQACEVIVNYMTK